MAEIHERVTTAEIVTACSTVDSIVRFFAPILSIVWMGRSTPGLGKLNVLNLLGIQVSDWESLGGGGGNTKGGGAFAIIVRFFAPKISNVVHAVGYEKKMPLIKCCFSCQIQFPHALKGNNLEGAASEDDVVVGSESWSSGSDEDDDQSPDYQVVGTTRETDRSRSVGTGSTACAGLGGGSSGSLGGGDKGGGSAAGAAAAAGGGGIGGMWVNRPRLALFGPPGCGQKQVAAAALHALDGVPVHSLALHSLHGDPSRTAEAALVRCFFSRRIEWEEYVFLFCWTLSFPPSYSLCCVCAVVSS